MSRIVFVTWDGGGNLVPALGIARELHQRGHKAAFLGQQTQRYAIEAAGRSFTAYALRGPSAGPPATAAERQRLLIRDTWLNTGLADDLVAMLARDPADSVVIDCMLAGALARSGEFTAPAAVLVHGLAAALAAGIRARFAALPRGFVLGRAGRRRLPLFRRRLPPLAAGGPRRRGTGRVAADRACDPSPGQLAGGALPHRHARPGGGRRLGHVPPQPSWAPCGRLRLPGRCLGDVLLDAVFPGRPDAPDSRWVWLGTVSAVPGRQDVVSLPADSTPVAPLRDLCFGCRARSCCAYGSEWCWILGPASITGLISDVGRLDRTRWPGVFPPREP
jgi:hypothetical protein